MSDQHGHIAALTQGARPDVVTAIRQASARTGVDFAYLLEKAAAESSLDPSAQASTSSARGLFQFVDKTWLDTLDKHGAEHGFPNVSAAIKRDGDGHLDVNDAAAKQYILALRDNPRISALMAAELAQDNKASLEQSLGHEVGHAELYMAHFLGAGGAAKFLSNLEANPDSEADYIVPAAARANQAVFYENGKALTLDQVFARFEGKFSEPPGTARIALDTPWREPAQAPQQLAGITRSPLVAAVPDGLPDPALTALQAAIIAAPDPALAALQSAHRWQGQPQVPASRTDVAMQMMTLTLLEAFTKSGDEDRNNPNEWVV